MEYIRNIFSRQHNTELVAFILPSLWMCFTLINAESPPIFFFLVSQSLQSWKNIFYLDKVVWLRVTLCVA